MIAVIQRVSSASVTVDDKVVSEIGHGLTILLGVSKLDTDKDAIVLADKIAKLRIFSDENDKLNLSCVDVDGEVLVISNFTLLASYQKGNRPDYFNAALPDEANRLYELFMEQMAKSVKSVKKGMFGEHMVCKIVNDGPITISMDSNLLKKN